MRSTIRSAGNFPAWRSWMSLQVWASRWDDEWQAVVAGELGRDPTPDEFEQLQSLLLSEYLHVIGRA